jgi:DNA-3-methyladenine glycosylase II
MGGSLQDRSDTQSLTGIPAAEQLLALRDPILARVIASQQCQWPTQPNEDPIWGLLRIVMAQQISTHVACRLADRVKSTHPSLTVPSSHAVPEVANLRALGLPRRRAQCCVTIVQRSDEIRGKVRNGEPWKSVLCEIKGIGPWTLSVFRIMVLRDPDELPVGDVGLERAIANVYGRRRSVESLGERWRPFRSVACWYLWRTLGNEQLG